MFIAPDGFDDSQKIKVIQTTVYTVNNDGTENVLKTFLSEIINDQDEQTIDNLIIPKKVMPLSEYKQEMSFLLNKRQFQIKYGDQVPEHLLNELPNDSVVWSKGDIHETIGCPHYICGCEQQCPECNKFYCCKFCHNEDQDHFFERNTLDTVRCKRCKHIQPFTTKCEKCDLEFCKFYCQKCKFMCWIGTEEKPFFHCDKCKICRIGDPNDWVHCDTCNRCVYKNGKHNCIPNQLECPICFDTLSETHEAIIELGCGHIVHSLCFEKQIQQSIYVCPVCLKYGLTDQQIDIITTELCEQIQKYTCHINMVVTINCRQCNLDYQDFKNTSNNYQCYKCCTFNTIYVETKGTVEDALRCRAVGEGNQKIIFTQQCTAENFIEICKQKYSTLPMDYAQKIYMIPKNKLYLLGATIFRIQNINQLLENIDIILSGKNIYQRLLG